MSGPLVREYPLIYYPEDRAAFEAELTRIFPTLVEGLVRHGKDATLKLLEHALQEKLARWILPTTTISLEATDDMLTGAVVFRINFRWEPCHLWSGTTIHMEHKISAEDMLRFEGFKQSYREKPPPPPPIPVATPKSTNEVFAAHMRHRRERLRP